MHQLHNAVVPELRTYKMLELKLGWNKVSKFNLVFTELCKNLYTGKVGIGDSLIWGSSNLANFNWVIRESPELQQSKRTNRERSETQTHNENKRGLYTWLTFAIISRKSPGIFIYFWVFSFFFFWETIEDWILRTPETVLIKHNLVCGYYVNILFPTSPLRNLHSFIDDLSFIRFYYDQTRILLLITISFLSRNKDHPLTMRKLVKPDYEVMIKHIFTLIFHIIGKEKS